MTSWILVAAVFVLLNASAEAQPAGRFGSHLLFSAGSATVQVPVSGLSNAFTLEAWINPTEYVWTDFWRQPADAPGSGLVFNMSMTGSGTIYFAIYSGGGGYPIFTVPPVPLNKWTHIAVTYDGSRIRIYFNAIEVARRNAAGNLLPTSDPMEIGAGFPGRIDEVRVHSRALTPEEIALDRATPVDPLEPFQVSITTPDDHALGVAAAPISATFSAAADPSAFTFALQDPAGAPGNVVPATVAYDVQRRTATLIPAMPLIGLTDYVARVSSPALAGDTVWTFRTAAPESDPRVALAFNEGAGTAVLDGSGNGNTSSLESGAGWSAGMYGGGVLLDGADNEIRVPVSDSLSLTTAFTFEAWIKPSANSWGDLWVQNPNEGLPLYSLSIMPAGTLYLAASLGAGWYPMFTTVAVPLNTWTHVAATYDGSRLRIYLDGLEVASRAAHGSLAATAQPIEISHGFSGSIDEVRIYNRALTANEIIADRQTTVDTLASFAVTIVTPRGGSTGVVSTPISATFSAAVDAATLNGAFELRNGAGAVVPASVSYAAATRTATLTPAGVLDPLADYTAHVSTGVPGIKDTIGRQLAGELTWSFRTASSPGAPSLALAFSEGTGVVTDDWSGNGNRATLHQGAAWGSGRFGSGLVLSGSAGASVAASESMRLTDAFTFEAWVNLPPGGSGILWFRPPDYQSGLPLYALQVVNGGAIDFAAVLNDAYLPLRTAGTIPPNVWTHVAATYDGSRMRLYVNAVESASRDATGAMAVSNEPMEIGPWITGGLDEVRIYRRALGAAEIAADMARPIDSRQSMISSIAPDAGPIGQTVTIAGVNFGAAQGTSVVTFNGVSASVSVWTDSAINAVVPSGATSGPVVVTKQGVPSNAMAFAVTGPQISASLFPPPNESGWNNSSVTVTFTCTGTDAPVSFCTSPRTISFAGAGIKVTGQATDQNGVTAAIVVMLNVDLAGPAVNVYSPRASAVFPPGTPAVVMKGSVVDVLSGASAVTCAGVLVTLTGQNFRCTVALHDGTNSIQIVASDHAGRTTTKDVLVLVGDVAPVSLTVSPAALTLAAGTAQPLAVFDDRGRAVTDGTWSTNNAAIATVSVEAEVPVVYALSPGTATLTVALSGLSAQTVVSVLAADAMPADGTPLWALTATSSLPVLTNGMREVVRGVPLALPDDPLVLRPALFFVERGPYFQNQDTTAQTSGIRAVTADGREAWKYTLPADPIFGGFSPVRQVVPDDHGGLIVLVSTSRPACCYQLNEAIRRLDVITGEVTWEYWHREANGRFSEVALHPDGTVFVVEKLSNANSTELVAIDGSTGMPLAKYDLTAGHSTFPAAANSTGPLIQDDGSVVTIVTRWDNRNNSQLPKFAHRVTLQAGGELSFVPLFRADGAAVNLGIGDFLSGPWPDGHGGLIIGNIGVQSTSGFANVAHVSAAGLIAPTVDLPFGSSSARDLQYVLSDNAAYVLAQYWEGSGVTGAKAYKLDPESLSTLGVFDLAGGPYVQLTSAIEGGGTLVTSHQQGDSSAIGYGLLAGWVADSPTVQTAATTNTADTPWPFRRGTLGRREAPNPRLGIFLKGHAVSGMPGDPFVHASLRIAPRNQARWASATGLGFQQDSVGNWFVAIGGHPDPGPCSGFLFGLTDYFDDVDLSNKRYLSPLRYALKDEDAIVTGLLLSNSHYQAHEVLYRCTPEADDPTYNSNSYAHGLLNKVGLPSPLEPSLLPFLQFGWSKPVPSTHFDPQP